MEGKLESRGQNLRNISIYVAERRVKKGIIKKAGVEYFINKRVNTDIYHQLSARKRMKKTRFNKKP